MNDPYKVLGVTPNSTDEEIKTAYRSLSQQYHPDHHSDSILEEIAEQKMAEINEAYDAIMNMRRGNAGTENNSFLDIRCMIEQGSYTAADNMLNQNKNENNAEWNFLKGTVCLSRGWLNDAFNFYQKAVQLEPSNREYQAAFNQMQNRKNGQMNGNPYGNTGNGNPTNCLCNTCQCLICTDCLCNCFGGGC